MPPPTPPYRRMLARSWGPPAIARHPFFCTFERTIRHVQKCPGQKFYLLILKSPASQEVLIYSVSEISLSDSCWAGQFRIPYDKPRNIGCHRAPSLTNCNCP